LTIMLPWMQSMIGGVDTCCSTRSGHKSGVRPLVEVHDRPCAAPQPARHAPAVHAHRMSDSEFLKLAEMCVNDPMIAVRLEDDRTSPMIWGEAPSLRVAFLQMCIRDRHDRCHELWDQLSEFERRDFLHVCRNGPPSKEYFYDILVNEQQSWKDLDDCVSTAGSTTSTRSIASSVDSAWDSAMSAFSFR